MTMKAYFTGSLGCFASGSSCHTATQDCASITRKGSSEFAHLIRNLRCDDKTAGPGQLGITTTGRLNPFAKMLNPPRLAQIVHCCIEARTRILNFDCHVILDPMAPRNRLPPQGEEVVRSGKQRLGKMQMRSSGLLQETDLSPGRGESQAIGNERKICGVTPTCQELKVATAPITADIAPETRSMDASGMTSLGPLTPSSPRPHDIMGAWLAVKVSLPPRKFFFLLSCMISFVKAAMASCSFPVWQIFWLFSASSCCFLGLLAACLLLLLLLLLLSLLLFR